VTHLALDDVGKGARATPPLIATGIAVLAAWSMACGHSDPFTPASQATTGPFDTLQPIRLTFSADSDLTPAWSADGRQLFYTFAVPNDPDHDRCVGVLPGGGGSRVAEKCPLTDVAGDSTTVSRWPAPGPGNLMAWTEYQTRLGRIPPDAGAIRIGTFDPADPGQPVRTLPYLAPSGLVHNVPTHLAWLSANELVYVANAADFFADCRGCPTTEHLQGLEIVRLVLKPEPATVLIVPGTAGATSLSVASDGSGFYYTLAADSQVYFHDVASGTPVAVHDFGQLGVPSDASVNAGILAALVNNRLAIVTLATGATTVFSDDNWILRLSKIAPNGRQIAVEAARLSQTDLYLLEVP
jgi:hypothetical protein